MFSKSDSFFLKSVAFFSYVATGGIFLIPTVWLILGFGGPTLLNVARATSCLIIAVPACGACWALARFSEALLKVPYKEETVSKPS